MHFTPGLQVQVPEDTEIASIDMCEIGDAAHNYDSLETELKPSPSHLVDNMEPDQR
jgi:hypothetical protein